MRKAAKYSSGFFDDNTSSINLQAQSRMNILQENDETSSSEEEDSQQSDDHSSLHVSDPKPFLPSEEIVTIDDSDDEQDTSYDNNNEEDLPDRHRFNENDDVRDSNDTVKNEESDSDNDVVCTGEIDDFVEKSRISSNISLNPEDKVSIENFELLKLLGTGAYGKVFLVKKKDGFDKGELYAMKVLEKTKVTTKIKTTEHTKTEREVLEKVIDCPFLAKMFYAFQTPQKLYLVLEFAQGGELFTHLWKAESFPEPDVRFYIAEIIVAIEQLHTVSW